MTKEKITCPICKLENISSDIENCPQCNTNLNSLKEEDLLSEEEITNINVFEEEMSKNKEFDEKEIEINDHQDKDFQEEASQNKSSEEEVSQDDLSQDNESDNQDSDYEEDEKSVNTKKSNKRLIVFLAIILILIIFVAGLIKFNQKTVTDSKFTGTKKTDTIPVHQINEKQKLNNIEGDKLKPEIKNEPKIMIQTQEAAQNKENQNNLPTSSIEVTSTIPINSDKIEISKQEIKPATEKVENVKVEDKAENVKAEKDKVDNSKIKSSTENEGNNEKGKEIAKPQESLEFFTYEAKKDDTLWKISQIYYGDGKYFPVIMEHNPSLEIYKIGEGIKMKILKDAQTAKSIYEKKVITGNRKTCWNYTILPGETVQSLSARFYKTKEIAARILKLNDDVELQPGEHITIMLYSWKKR